jgi:hypothetical protein
VHPVTATNDKRKQNRSRLSGGPTSVWISRETHRAMKEHAARRGQKLQWLADELIRRGLSSSPSLN